MQRFDCLSLDTDVFGYHFLEASAGTGKTFAIEHVFARLICSIEINQILVVTFTKAATRELKKRIRKTIQNHEAVRRFDEAQIFTIHGFCMRMLQELGLAAGLPIGLMQETSSSRVDAALKDFFEFQCSSLIQPEQLHHIVKDSVQELAFELKTKEPKLAPNSFEKRWEKFQESLRKWSGPVPELIPLFQEIRGRYKAMDGNFERQVETLEAAIKDPENPLHFRKLLFPKKKLFSHLKAENLKVKFKDAQLPSIFEWCKQELAPHINSASDPEEIFSDLLNGWKPIQRKLLLEEGAITPDDILRLMSEACQNEAFAAAVRKRYKAVLIDEFQDTDPVQWNIFRSLFLGHADVFYLIGDPKQSIYRFRNADLYTYLEAKNAFASDRHFHLDTNYRSSKEMIDVLNRLFNRNWLKLPKISSSLSYVPMKPGLLDVPKIADEKGPIHFYTCEDNELDYVTKEILHLSNMEVSFGSIAILVKDRYELALYLKHLKKYNIPVVGRTRLPITESLAFECIYEWIDAVCFPHDMSKAKQVLAGPLGGYNACEISLLEESPFFKIRSLLDEKGVICALQSYLSFQNHWDSSFQADLEQVLELFFAYVSKHGFEFQRAKNFFQSLKQKHPDDVPQQRGDVDQLGIQIMTMHASKGLEFDIVFAVGLGSKSKADDEEESAEKLRQLYVAMTRAKRRQYIPVPKDRKNNTPIAYFLSHISDDELHLMKDEKIITWEHVSLDLGSICPLKPQETAAISEQKIIKPFIPSYLLSFSALSKAKEESILSPFEKATLEFTKHNLPRGSEVGVFVHELFEKIFNSSRWNIPAFVEQVVRQEVKLSKWALWENAILKMVQDALLAPIENGWCLSDILPEKVMVEQEFLFEDGQNFIKGFIDLIVEKDGKIYFIDWKTNWLGPSNEYYTDELIEETMKAHEYHLQASIYARAIMQGWQIPSEKLGGAVYLFLRAPVAVFWRPPIYE